MMNQPHSHQFDLFCSSLRTRPDAVLCLAHHDAGSEIALRVGPHSSGPPGAVSDPESVLHPLERKQIAAFGSARRRAHYLAGRSVAKQALVRLLLSRREKGLALGWDQFSRIHIVNGVLGQPVLRQPEKSGIGVSIAHSDHIAAALAFDEASPMAVDVERVDGKHIDTIWGQLTARERELVSEFKDKGNLCTALWTVKEALAKVLRTGLASLRLSVYEVKRCQCKHAVVVTHFCRIPAYSAVSFFLPCSGSWCSLVLPRCVLNDDFLLQLQHGLQMDSFFSAC